MRQGNQKFKTCLATERVQGQPGQLSESVLCSTGPVPTKAVTMDQALYEGNILLHRVFHVSYLMFITVRDAGPIFLPSLQIQELGEGLRVQKSKLGVVAQTCNPRTWETVTGGLLLV